MKRAVPLPLIVLSACAPRGPIDGGKPNEVVLEISQTINRDVDILFVIENAGGALRSLQYELTEGFAAYAQVLKNLPGGLPNVHIGVVSSDMGAGAYDIADIPSCRHGGDGGLLQNQARGTTCGTGSLITGERFISNVNGVPNYTGSLEDVFGCIAPLGDVGCGFEHPLGSLLRALGADGNGPMPVENVGFLRENAFLAVVLLVNEDDCSAPANSTLFDPASRFVSDPLGPVSSYRCNEYGHVCGGKPPPRMPAGRTDLSGTCTSAEDGKLLRVSDVANGLKRLKRDSNKVLVAAIAGPPTPYVVELAPPTLAGDPNMWPAITHSCQTNSGLWADPAVRINDLVDAFGESGVFQSTCAQSFTPVMQLFAEQIGKALGPACLTGKVVDAKPATSTIEPDCTAVDHAYGASGPTDTPLRNCADSDNVAPCWNFGPSTPACATGKSIEFRRAVAPPAELTTTLTCKVCAANDTRPGCAY